MSHNRSRIHHSWTAPHLRLNPGVERNNRCQGRHGQRTSVGDYKECRQASKEQQRTNCCFLFPGNPAVKGLVSHRPVALRLRHLTDLPFSVRSIMASNLLLMHGHHLPIYSIDLIRNAGVDVEFVVDLIRNCVSCELANVSTSQPAFVIAKRSLTISGKRRARI